MKSLSKAERGAISRAIALLIPPPKLTVSQCADLNRKLSPEASAKVGQWDTADAEYQREIMDAISDPDVKEVVVMSSAQVGKTEIILNAILFHMVHDPRPILLLQPTLEMAEAFSKDRLAPMIRDSKALKGKVKDARARDSGNTLLHKAFPGGQITMAGANSPSSLASRPVAKVFLDERARYPLSAGTEGDPSALAWKRANNFYDRKLVSVSTPTVKGDSIETAWLNSDQRHFHVACPHCNHQQRFLWSGVSWPKTPEERPSEAYYICQKPDETESGGTGPCGALIFNSDKDAMLKAGVWIASEPSKGIAGFHLNELYSPWRTFGDVAMQFVEAKKGGKETLQVWTNTCLGEPWEDAAGESMPWQALMARSKPYLPMTVPRKGLFLTCFIDVQHDRLAVIVRAWGVGEESWLVYHTEIYGDPLKPDVWAAADVIREMDYAHESGETMRIVCTGVDSGDGALTDTVYRYCYDRRENTIATKGGNRKGTPIMGKPTAIEFDHRGKKIKGAQMWVMGVDTAKHLFYSRIRQTEGPGAYHFYTGAEAEYFQQLMGEKLVTKWVRGKAIKEWKKTRANEALDCEVGNYFVALYCGIKRTNWAKLQEMYSSGTLHVQQDTLEASVDGVTSEKKGRQEPEPAPPRPVVKIEVDEDLVRRRRDRPAGGRGGWMNGWR